MSVLEIILYILLGAATLTYVIVTMVKWVKHKKSGDKKNETTRDAEDM